MLHPRCGGHGHGFFGDTLGVPGSESKPPGAGSRWIGKRDAGTCLPSWMEQLESGWEAAAFCLQRSEQLPGSIRAAEIRDCSGLLGEIPTNAFQKLPRQKGLALIGANRGIKEVAEKKERKKNGFRSGQRELPLRSLGGVWRRGWAEFEREGA